MSDEKYLTKEKVDALVKAVTMGLQMQIAGLEKQLMEAEFKRAVAEWAVAGVLSRQLHLNVEIATASDPLELAKHVGRNAGYQFVHAAELQFKDHAELARLKNTTNNYYDFAIHNSAPDALPTKSYWPKPF